MRDVDQVWPILPLFRGLDTWYHPGPLRFLLTGSHSTDAQKEEGLHLMVQSSLSDWRRAYHWWRRNHHLTMEPIALTASCCLYWPGDGRGSIGGGERGLCGPCFLLVTIEQTRNKRLKLGKNEVTTNNNMTTNFVNKDCSTKMFNKHTKIGTILGHERDRDQISVQLNNRSTFCRSLFQLWFRPMILVV
jgi:hypothetical protein